MSAEEPKRYELFDIDRQNFITNFVLHKTTKQHIRAVCAVQAQNVSLSDASRAVYARDAGFFLGDEDAEIPDVYDSYTAPAALAEALFKGCPKLLSVSGATIEIVDEELFNSLDEGMVMAGFLAFQQQRGKTLSTRLNYLS